MNHGLDAINGGMIIPDGMVSFADRVSALDVYGNIIFSTPGVAQVPGWATVDDSQTTTWTQITTT